MKHSLFQGRKNISFRNRIYILLTRCLALSRSKAWGSNTSSVSIPSHVFISSYSGSFGSFIISLRRINVNNRQSWFNTIDSFSRRNPTNKLSAYLIGLSASIFTYDQLFKLYGNLNQEFLYNTMEIRNLQKRLEAANKNNHRKNGTPFHDIVLPDTSGALIDTRNLEARVFLVVCWASWCVPCRNENPYLNKLYQKYKDKGLKIIGISFDTNPDLWKKAIKVDKILWTHLIDSLGSQGDFGSYYTINSIPTLFVLDRNKKIISNTGSELESLIEKNLE